MVRERSSEIARRGKVEDARRYHKVVARISLNDSRVAADHRRGALDVRACQTVVMDIPVHPSATTNGRIGGPQTGW
eukprot:8174025-Pyramimonas_sp.AAC.1